MSYHVFFSFSQGLAHPLKVPKGTLASIINHVDSVQETLGIKRIDREEYPSYWETIGFPSADLDDKILCRTVEEHNRWCRWLYDRFAEWAKNPVDAGEQITPEDGKRFWHGLHTLTVPASRWIGPYYQARMETLYEVMRGRPTDGISFDAAKLSPKQAAAVICLFSEFLDVDDYRLDVPKGCDYLASSYDGGYEWCSRCGAVLYEDAQNCHKRACPVQSEWCDEDRPEWYRPAKGSDDA